MADRIKPQIEMSTADYKAFRAKCGKLPVRWVVEELLKSLSEPSGSDMVSLSQVLNRLNAAVARGEKRMHGRPEGSRDTYKREPRGTKQ